MRVPSLVLLSWLSGCAGRIGGEVQITQSEVIPTVFDVTVDFGGDPPDLAQVEVEGPDGDLVRRRIPLGGQDPHAVALIGLEPTTTYLLRVVVERGGVERFSSDEEVTTGQIPAELPDVGVEEPRGGHFDGYLFTSLPGAPAGPLLLDSDGTVLWWYFPPNGTGVSRAFLSRDGGMVIFADLNSGANPVNHLQYVSLDGTSVTSRAAAWLHHDFTQLPDGTIAYLAHDPRTLQGHEVLGDSVVELHPDGTRAEVFNIWDHMDVFPLFPGSVPAGSLQEPYEGDAIEWARCSLDQDPVRWPHANALRYLEGEDAYLVSFLCLDVIMRIDRPSGALDWVLGGPYGDFTLPDGDGDFLEFHHQLDWQDGELLVFVNGDQEAGGARVEGFALDEKHGVATPTWSYRPEPALRVPTLGDVQRLRSGNVLVNFGYAGEIHEVAPDGALVWKLSMGLGGALGYTTVLDTLYPRAEDR
ncbi:MAG: aryl-sulfate sulfotransferase [Pseudomonadota bacterium]